MFSLQTKPYAAIHIRLDIMWALIPDNRNVCTFLRSIVVSSRRVKSFLRHCTNTEVDIRMNMIRMSVYLELLKRWVHSRELEKFWVYIWNYPYKLLLLLLCILVVPNRS
jgi:hypothetical protein